MKLVSAALAACAAVAFAAPALAQARANNFRVEIDGVQQKTVRTVDFEYAQTAAVTGDRVGAKVVPGAVQLKLNATRSDTYLDDWMSDTKSPARKVRVDLLDPSGKQVVQGYAFANCWIAKSVWTLDAASNALASATWTLSCSSVARVAP